MTCIKVWLNPQTSTFNANLKSDLGKDITIISTPAIPGELRFNVVVLSRAQH